ncbi:metal-dependent hydrolase family protein [Nonomuraea sp. LPB2021202275-12-8]|uniref:metal-dependent hydrolase family protein n=1 Tax=Nonomuraea sp. LPB2021202275-12-8 TaxID=3120159 RepID=UPI00300CB246
MTVNYLIHATLIDGTGRDPVPDSWIRVEDGRIVAVGSGDATCGDAGVLDCADRTVMPGMIDAHAHLGAVDYLDKLLDGPRALYAAAVFREMESTLRHGFTTVRDAGYTDSGFRLAAESGMAPGPRMLVSNGPLSQTGGHSDFRRRHEREPVVMFDGLVWTGVVADGVEQVRWAAREVLRAGADQVKVMASGGCASHGDDVTDTQFTREELAAIVYEARARGKHVIAHAYNPGSIANAVEAGVRSIEHGNLLDEAAAKLMADKGTYLVPTIATFQLLSKDGIAMGMTPHQVEQIDTVLDSAFTSLRIAMDAGVRIGSGSDALGRHQPRKALELELQARVMGPLGAVRAATAVNAQIIGRGDDLGTIAEGYLADLLILDGSPADDITVLQNEDAIHAVLQSGRLTVDRRPETTGPTRRTT